MKKVIYIFSFILALTLTSCGDSFLTRYPDGNSISQDQFDKFDANERMNAVLRGLYSMIYSDGSSDHDEFGQRSIDLWGDICCGDIAVTGKTYGWLYNDEQVMTHVARNGYIWSFYYGQIHNINNTIRTIERADAKLAQLKTQAGKDAFAWPLKTDAKDWTYTDADVAYALSLAQALALRGYAYGNLSRFFTPQKACETILAGRDVTNFRCAPIYTQDNMDEAQGRAYSDELFKYVLYDLETAIELFENYAPVYEKLNNAEYKRPSGSKLNIDINVARGLLAYAYLNAAPYYSKKSPALRDAYYQNASKYAQAVINSGEYQMITRERLLTTGFNSIDDPSWIWAQKVTVETAGGLKSWFGQVDIHSYSYAWAGDTKVIDENLRNEIPTWDARAYWFNDGSGNSRFKDCPDGKFFSAKSPTSTKDEDIDREWESDNVFMRLESMYLIAAEAEYYLNNLGAAQSFLNAITDERVKTKVEYPLADDDYADYKAELSTKSNLLKAIYYNWRVEMWGEGYGLQTFRRVGGDMDGKRTRGGNHDSHPGGQYDPSDINFNMVMPTSEIIYNPMIPEDGPVEEVVRYTHLTQKN